MRHRSTANRHGDRSSVSDDLSDSMQQDCNGYQAGHHHCE